MTEKEYFHWLTDRDRIRFKITTGRGGAVEHYSLQFEARLDDDEEWTAIRRYDCSDYICHVHIYSPRSAERRVQHPGMSFKDGLQLAEDDIRQRWVTFKRVYVEGR